MDENTVRAEYYRAATHFWPELLTNYRNPALKKQLSSHWVTGGVQVPSQLCNEAVLPGLRGDSTYEKLGCSILRVSCKTIEIPSGPVYRCVPEIDRTCQCGVYSGQRARWYHQLIPRPYICDGVLLDAKLALGKKREGLARLGEIGHPSLLSPEITDIPLRTAPLTADRLLELSPSVVPIVVGRCTFNSVFVFYTVFGAGLVGLFVWVLVLTAKHLHRARKVRAKLS